jgi:hypothetical protein
MLNPNKNQYKTILEVLSSSLLLVFSCKGDMPIEKISKKNLIETTAFVKFVFPDTVYLNKLYNGKIEYKGVLDSITTSFDERTKSRYISFYMIKTKNIDYEMKQLYKVKLDTFGAIDNRTIPFYDLKFTELGVNYIDGIINDHITIDTLTKPKPTDKVRYIENVLRATHKVFVIESPK